MFSFTKFKEGIMRDGEMRPSRAKPYKNGGSIFDNLGPIKETYVPLPKDYSPILMKDGGETNPLKDGLKWLIARNVKPYKNGGSIFDNLGPIKDTYVPLPKDYSPILMKDGGDAQNIWKAFEESANEDNGEGVKPILPFYKDGGQVPHNMIKHSSPLAMNQHGLFQHDLYNAVQQTGFGIKSYVKYV